MLQVFIFSQMNLYYLNSKIYIPTTTFLNYLAGIIKSIFMYKSFCFSCDDGSMGLQLTVLLKMNKIKLNKSNK
jgi:hypothetical protein